MGSARTAALPPSRPSRAVRTTSAKHSDAPAADPSSVRRAADTTYVLNGNEAFNTAYFEIRYLNTFAAAAASSSSASASASASSSSASGTQSARPAASSSAAAAGSSVGGGGSGAFSTASIGGGALVGAALGVIGLWVAL
jgi:hypothetical protein